jgi:LAO/AO transport system kinase
VRGQGVPELMQAIADHRRYLQQSGGWAERERIRAAAELDRLLRDQLVTRVLGRIGNSQLEGAVDKIAARELDAHAAVERLLAAAGLS